MSNAAPRIENNPDSQSFIDMMEKNFFVVDWPVFEDIKYRQKQIFTITWFNVPSSILISEEMRVMMSRLPSISRESSIMLVKIAWNE